MNWLFERDVRRLAASAERVALIAEIVDRRRRDGRSGACTPGRRCGPIRVVRTLARRDQWEPVSVDVDGDRALLVEARPETDGPLRAFVLDSASGLVPLAWASAAAAAGRALRRVRRCRDGGSEPHRRCLDLATGAELATIPLDERERSADLSLAPDGRVAVATRAGVRLAGPGLAPRLLPGTKGALAHPPHRHDALRHRHDRPSGLGRHGRRHAHALGPPTNVLLSTAGDATGYGWIANGCVRVAAIPAFAVPPADGGPVRDDGDRLRLHREHEAPRAHDRRARRVRRRAPRRVPRGGDRPHLRR